MKHTKHAISKSAQADAAAPEMKPRRDHGEQGDIDIQSCSATDCTGLMPTPPQDQAELAHYNQVYPFLPGEPEDERPDIR